MPVNLTGVLRRIIERNHADLKAASQEVEQTVAKADGDTNAAMDEVEPLPKVTASLQRRQALYDDIQRLVQAGQFARVSPLNGHNGPMEGHINRLKLLKRSIYGRGSTGILRKRTLIAA